MPCYDSRNEPEYVRKESQEKINKLTRMLCEACRYIYVSHAKPPSLEVIKWWDEHKKLDESREKEEKRKAEQKTLRRRALNKLTTEEKKALGVSRFDE